MKSSSTNYEQKTLKPSGVQVNRIPTDMENFNKHLFIEDLKQQLKTEIKKYGVDDMDDLHVLISENIENECTYNYDCFMICMELNATDFTAYANPCNTISELAYECLYEFVYEELDMNELEELINE
jgi:hypothetical protein